jgi:Xaa-Pro dipeptidase
MYKSAIPLLCFATAALLGPVGGSSIWEAPKEPSQEHQEHHEHTKASPHDLTGVSHYSLGAGAAGCPRGGPDKQRTAAMYAPHRVAAAANMGAKPGDAVVVFGGDLEFRGGSDTEILFRQISSVWFLANLDLYNCVLMILVNPDGGLNTTALVERQTHSQDIFNGFLPPMEELAAGFAVDYAAYVDELPALLDTFLSANHDSVPTVFTDDEEKLESAASGVPMNINSAATNAGIDLARCVKDETEIELLRFASEVAAASHMAAWAATATASDHIISELSLEATFVDTSQTCGLRFQAYIPIVAAGNNGAILHYYKAAADTVDGEVLLLDASPETQGYCSDVTRTFPVNGVFTDKQKLVYDAVLASADAGIKAMWVGADWNVDVCYGSEEQPGAYWALTEALVKAGFIVQNDATMKQLVFGDADAGVPRAWGTFLPHSLGHGVGLNVHDMGATYSACGSALAAGHVMTVEPGVYFIDELLDDACSLDAKWYNCDLMNEYRGFGGVRLEDVVAVTAGEPDCLSCLLPRTTAGIEAAFALMIK